MMTHPVYGPPLLAVPPAERAAAVKEVLTTDTFEGLLETSKERQTTPLDPNIDPQEKTDWIAQRAGKADPTLNVIWNHGDLE